MTHRILSSYVSLACVLLASLMLVAPVHAQEWQQEIQIITTVRPGEPTYVLLDSLDAVFERTPDVRLRHSADDVNALPYDDHLDNLLAEGVVLNSATHAFIRYRFSLNSHSSQLTESIQDIYFISRFDENYADLPILFVDAEDPLVSDIILKNGIPNIVNMKSITTFRELLAFPLLRKRQETAMVEFAGRTLRDDYVPQRESLLKFLDDHMNLGLGTYVLTTSYEQKVKSEKTVQSAAPATTAASLR